ncbi:MAG: phosphatidate cytidylyltransferase [Myxococcales bacterium]|nr:phosphatidate cytidylyltransferase [Myxococcales bacterium]
MLTRLATGLLLAPLLVLLLVEGPAWAVVTVFVAASGMCVHELLAMAMPGRRLERVVGVATMAALQLVSWFYPEDLALPLVLAMAVPGFAVLARPLPIETALMRIATVWAAWLYVVLPLSFGLELAREPGRLPVVFALSLVFAGDTFAYFAGRALGRHKLYPVVSPKKTVEGAIGGLLGSVGVAAGFAVIFWPGRVSPVYAGLIGLVGGAVAQMGDFVESLIKRSCGVKDSGTILPATPL